MRAFIVNKIASLSTASQFPQTLALCLRTSREAARSKGQSFDLVNCRDGCIQWSVRNQAMWLLLPAIFLVNIRNWQAARCQPMSEFPPTRFASSIPFRTHIEFAGKSAALRHKSGVLLARIHSRAVWVDHSISGVSGARPVLSRRTQIWPAVAHSTRNEEPNVELFTVSSYGCHDGTAARRSQTEAVPRSRPHSNGYDCNDSRRLAVPFR